MFNANDHNLEETSKNAAEQFSDASLIPDWQQLEKKLDIELPVKKKRRRIAAIWFLFTMLFIGSFYAIYDGSYDGGKGKYITAKATAKVIAEQKTSTMPFNTEIKNQDDSKVNANQANEIVARNVADESMVNNKDYTFSGQPNAKSPLNFNNAAKKSKVVKHQLNKLTVKSPKEELLIEETEKESNANDYSISTITKDLQDKNVTVNSSAENATVNDSEKSIKPAENISLNKDSVNNTINTIKKNKRESKTKNNCGRASENCPEAGLCNCQHSPELTVFLH